MTATMVFIKRGIPVAFAILAGLAALAGLLFVPSVGVALLNWAGYIAAAALLLGVLNLLRIHLRRSGEGNVYSIILVISMLAVFGLAISDALGQTDQAVEVAFNLVQAPLEASLASLIAFFLLFSGVRLLRNRRDASTVLFLLAALFFLLTEGPWSATLGAWLHPIRAWIASVVVVGGMRGLLLGIALGVIVLAVRLLTGIERPYSS